MFVAIISRSGAQKGWGLGYYALGFKSFLAPLGASLQMCMCHRFTCVAMRSRSLNIVPLRLGPPYRQFHPGRGLEHRRVRSTCTSERPIAYRRLHDRLVTASAVMPTYVHRLEQNQQQQQQQQHHQQQQQQQQHQQDPPSRAIT
eukprot:5346632-Amphidinium_carterae.1